MIRHHSSERGQAIILLVLGMVVLLGFTALAIDGGMVYSERRNAQNAADAAALAGALQKANHQADSVVLQAAQISAANNHYNSSQVNTQLSGPFTDFSGSYYLVNVTITSTIDSAFAHFVYKGPLQNTVSAVARAQESQPPLPGYAIIAMENCLDSGTPLVSGQGGGSDKKGGGVVVNKGGIFLNTAENSSNNCALDPPNNGKEISAETGITSVGSFDYNGVNHINPTPIMTSVNGGVSIGDPLSDLPEPQCIGAGKFENGKYQPGSYSSLNSGTYAPGIYCINGDQKFTGNESIEGDGVVFYFASGGFNFDGKAYLKITAPITSNCLGTEGDPTASCTYKGIAIFAARNNASEIRVRGNGQNAIRGMVYALTGSLNGGGGGTDDNEAVIVGQAIVGSVNTNGGGDVTVTYDDDHTYMRFPQLSLWR